MKTINKESLEHAVLNQIETDLLDKDFEAYSEMMQLLLKDDKNKEILFNYLSDTAQENVKLEMTFKRYSESI